MLCRVQTNSVPLVKIKDHLFQIQKFRLALLAYMGATPRDGIRSGKDPILIEVLVFIWVLGFCLGEIKQGSELFLFGNPF